MKNDCCLLKLSVCKRLCLAGLWLVSVCAAKAPAAEMLFHCPFEGDVMATHASGVDFGVAREEKYVAGHVGQALQVDAESAGVVYLASGNLDKARGSIELWVRPDWNKDDTAWRALLWEEGSRKTGANCIWLWKYGRVLRFDVRDPQDSYICASIGKWKPGEWHHVVATWDYRKGLSLFVDGRLRGQRETTWKPRSFGRFYVGNRPPAGGSPARAALDELVIYADPLSAEQVAAAYAGTLKREPAPKKLRGESESSPPSAPPKLIFHLPLDGSATAGVAGGAAEPEEQSHVAYEAGLFGQAAHFTRKSRLRFPEPGNLNKQRGTIMFWVRPDFSGQQVLNPSGSRLWRSLFCEGPSPEKRIGSNQMWLWLFGPHMRFDVADSEDRYVRHSIAEWQADQWHQVACTWDHRSGRALYIDGRCVGGNSDSRKLFVPTCWDTAPFAYFQLGGDDRGRPFEGLIDDLRIYDGPLSPEQVRCEFGRVYPAWPTAVHVYYPVGKKSRLRWQLESNVTEPARGTLRWWVADPNGKRAIETRQQAAVLKAGTSAHGFEVPFTPAAAGRHRLVCRWQPEGAGPAYERSLDIWGVDPNRALPGGDRTDLELVEEIDCTKDLPPEKLVESAPSRVVHAACGAYREAGAARHGRFAVRVAFPEADCPYVVEWEYPDDKPRTMEMIAQSVRDASSEYELQTGVFTGSEYPLSDRMQTHRCLYWPRRADVALIFMTAENDRPAAAAKIRVFRVRGQVQRASAPQRPPATAGWRRHVGIYYEDPALCYDFGSRDTMPGFETLADRLITYMHYSGQDLFMYPGVWYHGPFYPSASQGTVMQRTHPHNFIEYLLLRFETEDIGFLPTINLHSLPSLASFKWRDEMLATGEAAGGPLAIGWDGSPNISGWHGTRPNYNILHPEVRRAVLTMVDEMLELYGDSPAFRGICFHLTKHCMLWFGNLDGGYNDYCVEAFERETDIHIPVAADDPGRAAKRYRWLMANAREPWIAWRCRALRAFYGEVAERLARKRPDLRLVLAMYRPVFRDVVPEPGTVGEGDFVRQINREGGLDPALYDDLSNVVLDRTIYPSDYRWYRAHRDWDKEPSAVRDLLTAPQAYGGWADGGRSWVNMHDRYWEDCVGRKGWEAFWGREHGWRVSTLNPTGRYALESYLIPLAQTDLMTFTKGGFLIGTHGMEEPLAEFSRAFRSLPARPFSDLDGVPAPLVVRTLEDGGCRFVYAVNPSQKALDWKLSLGGEITAVHNLRDGSRPAPGKQLELKMGPMSFQAYRIEGHKVTIRADRKAAE